MSATILTAAQIKATLARIPPPLLLNAIAEGFAAYSRGEVVAPPVGHLAFADPPGDVHIKYGYRQGGEYYVVKIASGFYDNPKLGLPSSNGCMLLFEQHTGRMRAILLDEGFLTDVRTALAGAVAARYLAPRKVDRIGIVGAGIQARLQLHYLTEVCDCRRVLVWGRNEDHLLRYLDDMAYLKLEIDPVREPRTIAENCNLIVTTTPASAPLLRAADIRPGAHITAVGADAPGKQELEAAILGRAGLVVADSISQCTAYGEIHHALAQGLIRKEQIVELGALINEGRKRENDEQVTVADLTGVAVQDMQIARLVCEQSGR